MKGSPVQIRASASIGPCVVRASAERPGTLVSESGAPYTRSMTRRYFLLVAAATVLGTYLATYLVQATDWAISQLPAMVGALTLGLEWAAETASSALPQSAPSLHALLSTLFVLPIVFLRQLVSPRIELWQGESLADFRRDLVTALKEDLFKGPDQLAQQQRMDPSLSEQLTDLGALMERPHGRSETP